MHIIRPPRWQTNAGPSPAVLVVDPSYHLFDASESVDSDCIHQLVARLIRRLNCTSSFAHFTRSATSPSFAYVCNPAPDSSLCRAAVAAPPRLHPLEAPAAVLEHPFTTTTLENFIVTTFGTRTSCKLSSSYPPMNSTK